MDKIKNKNTLPGKCRRKKAQSILEFCIAFILLFFFACFILEFAFYHQSYHGVQTFTDEVNSNLSLYDTEEESICSGSKNSEILSLVTSRAKKYFKRDISLVVEDNSDSVIRIASSDTLRGKNLLSVKIFCNTDGVSTKSNYVYSSPFLYRTGEVLSTVRSVKTPAF